MNNFLYQIFPEKYSIFRCIRHILLSQTRQSPRAAFCSASSSVRCKSTKWGNKWCGISLLWYCWSSAVSTGVSSGSLNSISSLGCSAVPRRSWADWSTFWWRFQPSGVFRSCSAIVLWHALRHNPPPPPLSTPCIRSIPFAGCFFRWHSTHRISRYAQILRKDSYRLTKSSVWLAFLMKICYTKVNHEIPLEIYRTK